jgi:hypothetical protein
MKFEKDGKVYANIDALLHEACPIETHYCFRKSCMIRDKALKEQDSCYTYAAEHQRETARYFGFEVIEDDTPTIAETVEKHSEDVKPDPTWQKRMQKEYRELKERYEKLHKMVTKYEAGTLGFTPNCSLELLCQQKRHMGEYLHDLEIRAEIEGVEL